MNAIALLAASLISVTTGQHYHRYQVPATPAAGGYYGYTYALKDEFTTAAAAGFSVPRAAEPGPGSIITVTDTDSAIAVSGGELSFSGAASNDYTKSRVGWTGQTRVAGKILYWEATPAGTNGSQAMGWSTADPPTTTLIQGVAFRTGAQTRLFVAAGDLVIGTYTAAKQTFAVGLRSTGWVLYQKISGRWVVQWTHNLVATTPMYPSVNRFANALTVDNVRVLDTLWQTPVQVSDSFNRANGALGSTDGAGTEEPGGSGAAWSALQGTIAVASNVAAFSARDGTSGVGLATVDAGVADVVLDCTLTTGAAAGGRPGVVFHATDSANYSVAYVDNSANLFRIDEVVAGSVTNKASVAATVADSTAYRVVVVTDGSAIRGYFNNATLATATGTAGLTATKVGLWTDTAVDVTYENFSAKPRYVDTLGAIIR